LRPGWDHALYERVRSMIDAAVQNHAADLQGADVRDIARTVLGDGWTL
jgi:DNA-binding protein Fis